MATIFDIPESCLADFLEELEWRQGRVPNAVSMVRGCVFHGRILASSYASLGQGSIKKYTDAWTVTVPAVYGECREMTKGDTLTRIGANGEKLTIQSIVKEEADWVISATSSNTAVN